MKIHSLVIAVNKIIDITPHLDQGGELYLAVSIKLDDGMLEELRKSLRTNDNTLRDKLQKLLDENPVESYGCKDEKYCSNCHKNKSVEDFHSTFSDPFARFCNKCKENPNDPM